MAFAASPRSRRSACRHSCLSASVTPDKADTTTSTRAPSARRLATSSRMFCQRGNVATLVPPNFITIQGASGGNGAEVGGVTWVRCQERGIRSVLRCGIGIANGFASLSVWTYGRLDIRGELGERTPSPACRGRLGLGAFDFDEELTPPQSSPAGRGGGRAAFWQLDLPSSILPHGGGGDGVRRAHCFYFIKTG